jgi:hypothetical protein
MNDRAEYAHEREALILELRRESGDQGADDVLIADWKHQHRDCCLPDIGNAAWGDITAVLRIRECMGLPQRKRT